MLGGITVDQIVSNSRTLGAKSGSALGSWVIGQWYAVGDIVNYQGNLYTSVQAGIGQTPTSAPAYWSLTGAGMPMDAITDPALNAAVTTAKVDAYSGTIITLTAAGNDQTIQDPTDTTAGKKFWVVNDSESSDEIDIIFGGTSAYTITLQPGEAAMGVWNGAYWTHGTGVDADDIDYNPAASYLSDTNVQSAFDTVFTSDGFLFTKGTQNYLFTDQSSVLALQGQTSASASGFGLYSKDGDGTDDIYFEIFGVGTPSNVVNREKLQIYYDKGGQFVIRSEADGTGTLRPIQITTEGNANQLYLATDGTVQLGTATPVTRFGQKFGTVTLADFGGGVLDTYSNTISHGSILDFNKSRQNTQGNTLLTNDDVLGYVNFRGADGTAFIAGAEIRVQTNGTPALNNMPSEIIFSTNSGTAAPTISSIIHKDAMLDLYGGTISILAGADTGLKTRTNLQPKTMLLNIPAYESTGVASMVGLYALNNVVTNSLSIGGGHASYTSPIAVKIFTSQTQNVLGGTEVARFEGGATKALMMGLGNSSLEAWNISWTAFQIGGNASIYANTASGASKNLVLTQNAYKPVAGSDIYQDTDEASRYLQYGGVHQFDVAVSGTAGDPITWTTALTIANDGNVGIGVATPTHNATVYTTTAPAFDGSQNAMGLEYFGGNSPDDVGAGLQFAQRFDAVNTSLIPTGAIFGIKDAATGAFGGGLTFYTHPSSGSPMDESMRLHDDAMLDLYGGTITILAGAESGAKTRTSGQTKLMLFGMPMHTTDTPNIASIIYGVTDGSNNIVNIGGGSASMNAASLVRIFVDDDLSTASGTEVARFEGGAAKALMMGLGNSSLEAWGSTFSAFQLGGNGAMYAITAQGASGTFTLMQNAYFNGVSKYISTDEASRYIQGGGTHQFEVAPSGTADATITFTTALTIANDASATFGGAVSIPATKQLYFDGGGDTWIYESAANLLDLVAGGIVKISMAGGANGLITLSGGTGGVQLGDTVGIGAGALGYVGLYGASSVSAGANVSGWSLEHALSTTGASSVINGLVVAPSSYTINHASAHDLFGAKLIAPTVTETLGTVGTSSMLYIDDAMSTSGTDYSIFVDAGRSRFDGFINHGTPTVLTLNADAVAVTGSYHIIDTAAGAAADNLITATGGVIGDELYLQPNVTGEVVTVKDGTGADTFILAGGADFVMDHVDDRLHLLHNGTEWVELSRSSNS